MADQRTAMPSSDPATTAGDTRAPGRLGRFLAALAVGIIGGLLCWQFRIGNESGGGAGDLSWAIRAAADLLAGRDPYDYPPSAMSIPYPLPAVFIGIFFIGMPAELAAAIFFGGSSAILAYGLTRENYRRLLIFLSSPYLLSLLVVQWSPLIAAAAFFPILMMLVLVKPQVALPVGITYLSRTGVIITTIAGVASLILMPTWPVRWLSQIGEYERFIPILTLTGLPVLIVLRWYRQRDALLLLLAAIMPQRALYDALTLYLIPKTRIELLATVLASWVVFFVPADLRPPEAYVVTISCYLPMVVLLIMRQRRTQQ
ncbi:MAG TPA: hypothetical protein PKA05_22500 [Roseiflexaceae bacterium]|nr:hypothetical protein [Roseiflexaceae bacterium]HMP43163.1 hypothetical protein [Roseiflexaceae bacterium]